MGYVRTRTNGQLAFVFSWKGKKHTKGLGTTDEKVAEQIRQDANAQLDRIRKGESALASKLLADGHSIVDVLFGSEEIGHLIASPADDNPLTVSQLKEAFIDNLQATSRTPGHVEGTRVHLDHFIRVLGDVRVMSLTDADMTAFQNKRGKETTAREKTGKKKVAKKKRRKNEQPVSKRLISQGTIRSDFKSLRSAVNWAMSRKPPLLAECPFTIPKITETTVKPFLPTEEIQRLLGSAGEEEQNQLLARWLLDLKEINSLIEMTATEIPEMLLPMQLVCSTGMRRVQLVRLRPSDYVKGRLTIRSKKGARQKGLSEISLTIELRDSVAKAVREHVEGLPKRSKIMFPIFEAFDYSGSNKRWKGKSKRSGEQRRCDKADRLFEKLVKGTDFERLDGYHALRHSFISILVAQGKTWDQIAAFVGHLDQRTTQRYIHFMPKDKRETANSIPFEF
ncbi:MAG: tyrosine-type recombinase/integrase [Phycisphaerae bacterium]